MINKDFDDLSIREPRYQQWQLARRHQMVLARSCQGDNVAQKAYMDLSLQDRH
jgi:hypothetical protein